MCFPGKRLKNNHADDAAPPAKFPPTPAAPPASAPATQPATSATMSSPKVAIVIYSMYGHIAKLAESVKQGVESAGGSVTIYQISETLPEEILAKMHAPAKPNYPILAPGDLANFDAFLFGVPTRYGNFPAQWKNFWDATGQLWASGGLYGKYVSVFVSTASPGGGQESTVIATLSTFTHHGMIFVPFGYAKAFGQLTNLSEVHGGSPWGAGTFAAGDGSRQPSALELEIAQIQGKSFWETVSKVKF
uniref:Polygalacturonase (PG) ) n=1 Tax=Ganoderma boninense TaxID=34458 RepID=A0A5K1K5S4_9APHY|nr:Polygalacturonase (PG) (EC (Pectinase) [Ganoderma boninense]